MAGRALPAQAAAAPPPDPLDALVGAAVARSAAQVARSRKHAAAPLGTLADLERASTIAPRPEARPTALILTTTIATCSCGAVYRTPGAYALARYEANAHSFRYSRTDTTDCTGLPREKREVHVNVPFCEECF